MECADSFVVIVVEFNHIFADDRYLRRIQTVMDIPRIGQLDKLPVVFFVDGTKEFIVQADLDAFVRCIAADFG